MGEVVQLTAHLESFCCWDENCGIQFAMPRTFALQAREYGTTFYCPRGHRLRFGESEVDKLKRRLELEKNRRESAEREEERARRASALARGKLKAQSQRVKNGICPCCDRSFQNLRRHMASKHPDWTEE